MAALSPFDMAAAWSRRAGDDLPSFMAALAERLQGALPGHVVVDRSRDGVFSSTTHVSRILAHIGAWRFEVEARKNRVSCRRTRVVREVALSTQDLPVTEWLAAVAEELKAHGDEDGRGHDALQAFLLS